MTAIWADSQTKNPVSKLAVMWLLFVDILAVLVGSNRGGALRDLFQWRCLKPIALGKSSKHPMPWAGKLNAAFCRSHCLWDMPQAIARYAAIDVFIYSE
ncbi:hypothetical protein [Methylogaea oryzae]|uniref:hypothetical protein n=1 Tax=Methylogaea oryzae TaxID=1295382 RepID=UPI00138ED4DD|nr:hypothetical protein [Methylogaea oryzae]